MNIDLASKKLCISASVNMLASYGESSISTGIDNARCLKQADHWLSKMRNHAADMGIPLHTALGAPCVEAGEFFLKQIIVVADCYFESAEDMSMFLLSKGDLYATS